MPISLLIFAGKQSLGGINAAAAVCRGDCNCHSTDVIAAFQTIYADHQQNFLTVTPIVVLAVALDPSAAADRRIRR